jgi:hypothetical protein
MTTTITTTTSTTMTLMMTMPMIMKFRLLVRNRHQSTMKKLKLFEVIEQEVEQLPIISKSRKAIDYRHQ